MPRNQLLSKPGTTKYGPSGFFAEDLLNNLNISEDWKLALCEAANHSLAAGTWSCYKTAVNNLKKCQTETNIELSFPLDETKTLTQCTKITIKLVILSFFFVGKQCVTYKKDCSFLPNNNHRRKWTWVDELN